MSTIKLHDAQDWVKKWQTENNQVNQNGELKNAKAFLIPANDLVNALIEMEVLEDDSCINKTLLDSASVRAYLGIDRPANTLPSAETEKLVIVATTKEVSNNITIHRDIIEGYTLKNPPPHQLIGTGIFDFTSPCPSNCDTESPLFKP